MKIRPSFLVLIFIISCSTKKEFIKEKICSPHALFYINNSKQKTWRPTGAWQLQQRLAETQRDIQKCYERFRQRTELESFQTCMVVGVDTAGKVEYYNFSSQEIHADRAFIQCAAEVTQRIPYWQYGTNYILLQTYSFY